MLTRDCATVQMSSRAFRRLQKDVEVIRVIGKSEGEKDDDGGEQSKEEEAPVLAIQPRRNLPASNLFALLGEDAEEEEAEEEREGEGGSDVDQADGNQLGPTPKPVGQFSKKPKKKKKKKKSKLAKEELDEKRDQGTDDVDAAIKEVNEMLGEVTVRGEAQESSASAALHRSLLGVDRRYLNADHEMRRIFGSKVVREELGRRRAHKKTYHRPTALATARDTWPRMDKPGLSMQLAESQNGCQYFVFEHSSTYQKIQFQFLDAVETFDPNAIGAVLHAHPYHIDSLLQLSEVCRMSEDVQMAAELIERSLFCFECCFHALFNYTQGNCRLSYSRAENRPFFLALFRHLYYVGRKGCHRTALEFCKLLLSLDPDGDPLCVLLMLDYYALRAGEYGFLINLFREWEANKNLSQLPNFAFSVPLAMFHSASEGTQLNEGESIACTSATESDERLQEALIMFPSYFTGHAVLLLVIVENIVCRIKLLFPLLDKCGVTLDSIVMKHPFFNCDLVSDPEALRLLTKLYIERSHSVWKEPEVLTWLEANARRVVARVDSGDTLIEDCARKRKRRYVGTPRNIYRHMVISEFEQVVASLPRELTNSPIMMYDPLPPLDSTCGYTRPERTPQTQSEHENPFLLLLRSLLPNFNPQGIPPVGADPRRQMQQQMAGGGEGAEGGGGRPLNIQPMLDHLSESLQALIDELRPPRREEESEEESSDEGRLLEP